MTLNHLLKPVELVQEKNLLALGSIILIIASIVAYAINIRFDGVIDIHTVSKIQWYEPFIDNLINTLCLTICLYAAAFVINTKTRFVDLLNTALIARIPLYIAALSTMGSINKETNDFLEANIATPSKIMDLPMLNWVLLGLSAIAALIALVYMGVLLYQGFKIATNLKKFSHKLLLLPVIIVAEILSKYLVYFYSTL